jgi:MFS transporter, ACS family, glucarate transporter
MQGLERVERDSGVRWRILLLIVVASFIAYLLRSNMSVVGENLIDDLGLTEQQLGMIFSAFAAGYAIFQIPGGMLGDRFGARKVLMVAALCWATLTILTALVPGSGVLGAGAIVASLVVLRFLVGATQAPLFPVTGCGTVSNWFPVGSWGLPNGLSSTGLTLGAAATAPLLVWLMEFAGWRGALLITAPAGIVLAAAWWWYVRDYPRDHPAVNKREQHLIDAGRPPPDPAAAATAWRKALANPDVLLLTISYFCMNYVFYLFFNWFFYYLVQVREFSAQDAGILTSAQWILGAIGATAGGFICDYLSKRYGLRWGPRWLAIPSLLLCAVLLYFGANASTVTMTVTLLCICFGCTQLTEAAYWATTISVSGRHCASAGGVLNTGGNCAGFVGGLLVPIVSLNFGWTMAVSTGAAFALIGAVLWCFIRGDRNTGSSDAW